MLGLSIFFTVVVVLMLVAGFWINKKIMKCTS